MKSKKQKNELNINTLMERPYVSDALYDQPDRDWRMRRYAASCVECKGAEFFSLQKDNFTQEELVELLTIFNEVIDMSEDKVSLYWKLGKKIADLCN